MIQKCSEILKYIQNGKSIREILEITGLSYTSLSKYLNVLRNNGYPLQEEYYINGDIVYSLIYDNGKKKDHYAIITTHYENDFKIMLISDLHFGSVYESSKYLNLIYDYCTKENIHFIFNIGDLIEGDINKDNMLFPWDKQIDHALRIYPFSNDITNFLLLGNHDYSVLINHGLDISKVIKEKRFDIVPLGFKESIVRIKSDKILLQHPLTPFEKSSTSINNNQLIIKGHRHTFKNNYNGSNLIIYVPSLSKLNFNKCPFPGALLMGLKTRYGLIEYVNVENLCIINNKLITSGENSFYVGYNKSFKKDNIINNEEDYPKVMKKVL